LKYTTFRSVFKKKFIDDLMIGKEKGLGKIPRGFKMKRQNYIQTRFPLLNSGGVPE